MVYKYYAVRRGHIPGVYLSWEECKKQINGYKGQEYKGFNTLSDAESFNKGVQQCNKDVPLNAMTAYTDGSFNNSIGKYGSGGIILPDEHEFSFCGCESHMVGMRNVAGEIQAARYAMEYAIERKCNYLRLYYDYEGVEKWCTHAWNANQKGTKEYQNYYDNISTILYIEFIHVKAHSGDKYNDIADILAKRSVGL